MKRLLLLLMLSPSAWADTLLVTYTPATTRVDGSYLPPNEIDNVQCDIRAINNSRWLYGGSTANALATSFSFGITLAPGEYEVACRTKTDRNHEPMAESKYSVYSNLVEFEIPTAVDTASPSPPTSVIVTIS